MGTCVHIISLKDYSEVLALSSHVDAEMTCVGWWLGDLWGRRIKFVILGCPSGRLLGVPSARGLHRLCGLTPSHPDDT